MSDELEAWPIESRSLWLEMRKRDLTASAIGAIFGVHPYISPEQLAARMSGTSDAGSSTPPNNPSMRRGRILEAGVAVAVAEERPQWTLEKALSYHRMPGHRIGATPDYFIRSTDPAEAGLGILEIKTVNPEMWDRWHARPPLAYMLQCLVQQMCTGADYGWIACMVTSASLPVYYTPVPRHRAAEERIKAAAAAWWAEFDSGRLAPAAEAAELDDMLDDGSSIALDGNNQLPALLDERELLKQSLSAEEKRVKEIDDTIKKAIGRARTAWLPNWAISYQTQHRKETLIPARDIRVLRVRRLAEQDAADE
jgi:predicted phage-related endonuclease